MSIVREFERAFNRQDVDALVACFTPSGTYRDNFFGDHAGSAGLREMFARMFHEGRDYVWHMDAVVETPERRRRVDLQLCRDRGSAAERRARSGSGA